MKTGSRLTIGGFFDSLLITSSESQEVLWSGHGYQRPGPLQLLLEHPFGSWLAEGCWRLGSMLCCNCVRTCVLQGRLGCSCRLGCMCAQCMHSWCIWNVRFLTSMLSEMCVRHSLLIPNQTSDGSPCEYLANSYTCYFPSVEWTQGIIIQHIMSRNMQISGRIHCQKWNLFLFLQKWLCSGFF